MKPKAQHNWSTFLKLFSEQNKGRRTRLAVFEGTPESLTDYWLEDHMPLMGIDLDPNGADGPTVEIMLQRTIGGSPEHMTHRTDGVRLMKFTLGAETDDDGLNIINRRGQTTLLRFE